MIKRHDRELKALKSIVKTMVIPIVTLDPVAPVNGQIWYRSDTNVFKKRQGGTTKNWETA